MCAEHRADRVFEVMLNKALPASSVPDKSNVVEATVEGEDSARVHIEYRAPGIFMYVLSFLLACIFLRSIFRSCLIIFRRSRFSFLFHSLPPRNQFFYLYHFIIAPALYKYVSHLLLFRFITL